VPLAAGPRLALDYGPKWDGVIARSLSRDFEGGGFVSSLRRAQHWVFCPSAVVGGATIKSLTALVPLWTRLKQSVDRRCII
jgi:hypothetical protein